MSKARLAPSTKDHASPSREAARAASGAAAYRPPPYGIELVDQRRENRTGLPDALKAGLETLSGVDLSHVRVHRDSPAPARVNALAYTQGHEIHLGPGQDAHLAHELWHVVQQGQGRVRGGALQIDGHTVNDDPGLEREADRMGARALGQVPSALAARALASPRPGGGPPAPIQRYVRTGGGATKVDEAKYQAGGASAAVGTKRKVADLIADPLRRVFADTAELESYANGKTDYIGDVKTASAGVFWYRLPKDKLTVLGEEHSDKKGNVEDVILGLGTSRFMYEPYSAVNSLTALNVPLTSTQARVDQIHAGRRTAGAVDTQGTFNPALEDIVIKALTGATVARTQFIAGDPATMTEEEQKEWKGRATKSAYSFGERIALYLALAIHITSDLSKHDFGAENFVESPYVKSSRRLKNYYLAHQGALDAFMNTKDADDLVGIYELTASKQFKNLRDLERFTVVFHEYASRYIEQLGKEKQNPTLESEGKALFANKDAELETFSPAREEIMWERVKEAVKGGYLLVGMGDAHRKNLKDRLDRATIPHAKVAKSLTDQKGAVDAGWVP
jgi:hypothetical protein